MRTLHTTLSGLSEDQFVLCFRNITHLQLFRYTLRNKFGNSISAKL